MSFEMIILQTIYAMKHPQRVVMGDIDDDGRCVSRVFKK